MGCVFFVFFFFNDTATTEIYTLSLHDALPIVATDLGATSELPDDVLLKVPRDVTDRKSPRLNSSHEWNSYAVFCSKKKSRRMRAAHVDRLSVNDGTVRCTTSLSVCLPAHGRCFPLRQRRQQLPFFLFNDTATTEIYTLSLHDALPI